MKMEHIIRTFQDLVGIDAPSRKEKDVAEYLKKRFQDLGIILHEDEGGKRCGSDSGNLYAYVEGELESEPILLSAHMDTVSPAYHKRAVLQEDGRITSDGTTVLGADDIAGITAIYEAVACLKENGIRHRDFELLFTVCEELYCEGAKQFDFAGIRSKQAYVLDLSGTAGMAAYAAPTILSFQARILGKAAHAGFSPEEGVHAIRAAACAISELHLGRMDEDTTANIGTIKGGEGKNIVPPECVVSGEIRSLCHEKALKTAEEYRRIFERVTTSFGAKFVWQSETHIHAYRTAKDSRTVQEYRKVCENLSIPSELLHTFGGSDNNVFAQQGIEGIVIATAMFHVHSCEEYANIEELEKTVRIVKGLLTNRQVVIAN